MSWSGSDKWQNSMHTTLVTSVAIGSVVTSVAIGSVEGIYVTFVFIYCVISNVYASDIKYAKLQNHSEKRLLVQIYLHCL